MKIKYTLPDIPYTLQDIHLGVLIPSVKQPNQDAFPSPPPALEHGSDYRWRNERNVDGLFKQDETGAFRAHITKLFNFGRASASDHENELHSKEGRIYELLQPRPFFEKLVADDATRSWLVNAHDQGDRVHMIVGYRTYFNASRQQLDTRTTATQGTLEAPVGHAVSAVSGAPPVVTDELDSSVEAARTELTHEEYASELPGERVFAICFRRVHFKLFNSRSGRPEDVAKLEKQNCWILTSFRSDEDDDNAVEAILGDEVDGDDLGSSLMYDASTAEEYLAIK